MRDGTRLTLSVRNDASYTYRVYLMDADRGSYLPRGLHILCTSLRGHRNAHAARLKVSAGHAPR